MKKAFTLIELMISIILLSLIVSFLYQSVAQLQSSNQQFLDRTNKIQKREEVLKLLYNDFINARSVQWYDKEQDVDIIVVQSSNSLHGMSEPYLTYRVYKDNNTLRRIEGPAEKFDLFNKIFRFNEITEGVKLFKVYEQKGHYLIYLKIEGMDDIYLDILPPALFLGKVAPSKTAPGDTNSTENNSTNTEG